MSSEKSNSVWTRQCKAEDCVLEPVQADTKGDIPSWLNGVLYRTGPGVGQFGKDTYNHAFDPIAVLHAFEVREGVIKYRSRVLNCESYKKNEAAQRITMTEFGTVATPDPCQTILGRFMARFLTIPDQKADVTDNGAVNVFFQGDQLFATTETNTIVRVDPATLEAMGGTKHSDYVAVHQNTAHPHEDPDGTVYNMGNSMIRGKTFYNVVKFPPPVEGKSSHEQASILVSMPSTTSNPSYYHSFAMTENHIVITEMPMTWNNSRGLFSNMTRTAPVDFFDYDPKKATLIHLFDKATGDKLPLVYSARAYACFHHINAYEEEGQVVLDLVAADGNVYSSFYFKALSTGNAGIPYSAPIRFVLPLTVPEGKTEEDNLVTLKDTECKAFKLGNGKIKILEETLNVENDHVEFPRINYGLNGKKYKYFYCASVDPKTINIPCLFKMDTVTKKPAAKFTSSGLLFSEPVFVPRPGATEEDDGIVLAMMHSEEELNSVALLLLDGKTFAEVGRCEVKTDGPVPFTLHGLFSANETGKAIFA